MTLALQLITYKSARFLPALLTALKNQTIQGWTLYVRDHSESSEEQARIHELLRASDVPHVFEAGLNTGFAGGHNALFEQHQADAVALVNPDLVPDPGYYQTLLTWLETHPDAGSCQGVLLRERDGVRDGTVDSLGLDRRGIGDIRDAGAGTQHIGTAEPRRVFGVSGAGPVYRRTSLEKAAPTHGAFLDSRFFLYKEDVELAFRLHRAGEEAWLVPQAMAGHGRAVGSHGFVARVRDEFKRSSIVRVSSAVNQWKIYMLHGTLEGDVRSHTRTFVAELGRIALLALSPHLLWRALREILRDRASLHASRKIYHQRFIL